MESLSAAAATEPFTLDVAKLGVRGINRALHQPLSEFGHRRVRIVNPAEQHNLAVGLREAFEVEIMRPSSYRS